MKRILAIGAHPDDVDFGCAGTVAKETGKGSEVSYLILTDGSKGGHATGLEGKKLIALRIKEQKAAAKVLGVKHVDFFLRVDGELENTKELRRKIAKHVRKLKPHIVFAQDAFHFVTQFPGAAHRDHRQAGEASFDAIYPGAGNRSFFPELQRQGFVPWKIQEMWLYMTEQPNTFVDISRTFEKKIKALLCHKSQHYEEKTMRKRVEQRAKETGKKKKMRYAEAFRVVRFN